MISSLTREQEAFKDKLIFEITGGKLLTADTADQEYTKRIGTKITDFYQLIKNVVELETKDSDRRILVTSQMPEDKIFQDPDVPDRDLSGIIVTSLEKRGPATLAGGNSPFDASRRDVKAKMVRKVIGMNPERPGETSYIISKIHDNLINVMVCAQTNKRADELTDWFEELMELYRWYFGQNGFHHFYLDERAADLWTDNGTYKIAVRPMTYYVRTETNYVLSEPQLNRIVVQLTTSRS